MLKYWTLYWKDIDKMTKEELKQHLVSSRNEINALHNELSDLYIKHWHLFLSRSKQKNFLQKLLWI